MYTVSTPTGRQKQGGLKLALPVPLIPLSTPSLGGSGLFRVFLMYCAAFLQPLPVSTGFPWEDSLARIPLGILLYTFTSLASQTPPPPDPGPHPTSPALTCLYLLPPLIINIFCMLGKRKDGSLLTQLKNDREMKQQSLTLQPFIRSLLLSLSHHIFHKSTKYSHASTHHAKVWVI